MSVINIAIVEDDPDVRDSMKYYIDQENALYCCGAFSNAEDLISKFRELDVDIVLMDITLPELSGIQCVQKLKAVKPKVQFLMCTAHADSDNVFNALCAGATGYILKGTSPEKLIEAISDLYNGGSPMSSEIARMVVAAFPVKQQNNDLLSKLTPRETEILMSLSKGYQYKQVADLLSISTETVRTYVRNIYEKLQVHSRTEALNKLYNK